MHRLMKLAQRHKVVGAVSKQGSRLERAVTGALGLAGFALLRLWSATLRYRWFGDDHQLAATRDGPCIYAFWHGQQLPLLVPYRAPSRTILISWSRDGRILDRIAKLLGYKTVRGSSSRGGESAVNRLAEHLARGRSVALAVDGPRGPQGVPKSGAARLSALSKRPILPIVVSGHGFHLSTWDRFFLPFPFSRVEVHRLPMLQASAEVDPDDTAKWNDVSDMLGASLHGANMQDPVGLRQKRVRGLISGDWPREGPTPARIYCLLLRLLEWAPSTLWRLWCRLGGPGSAFGRERLGERCWRVDAPMWIHAASVGEVGVASTFIERVRRADPSADVVLTTTTVAGRGQGTALALTPQEASSRARRDDGRRSWGGDMSGPEARAALAPLDLPRSVSKTMKRMNPRALILIETELWPVLISSARARGLPVLVVNGRISDRTFARYLRLRKLFASVLADVEVWARSTTDAERFRAIGVAASKCRVIGDLKLLSRGPGFRTIDGPVREWLRCGPLVVAASTHGRESDLVLAALEPLWDEFPTLKCVIAPRRLDGAGWTGWRTSATGEGAGGVRSRPAVDEDGVGKRPVLGEERVPGARGAASGTWCRAVRRSVLWTELETDVAALSRADVLWLDRFGVLGGMYPYANAVFVGGSMVPGVGGHNLLEVAQAGAYCLYGPHTESVRIQRELIETSRAGECVDGVEDLRSLLRTCLSNQAEYKTKGNAGRLAVQAASARVSDQLNEQIDQFCKRLKGRGGGR